MVTQAPDKAPGEDASTKAPGSKNPLEDIIILGDGSAEDLVPKYLYKFATDFLESAGMAVFRTGIEHLTDDKKGIQYALVHAEKDLISFEESPTGIRINYQRVGEFAKEATPVATLGDVVLNVIRQITTDNVFELKEEKTTSAEGTSYVINISTVVPKKDYGAHAAAFGTIDYLLSHYLKRRRLDTRLRLELNVGVSETMAKEALKLYAQGINTDYKVDGTKEGDLLVNCSPDFAREIFIDPLEDGLTRPDLAIPKQLKYLFSKVVEVPYIIARNTEGRLVAAANTGYLTNEQAIMGK